MLVPDGGRNTKLEVGKDQGQHRQPSERSRGGVTGPFSGKKSPVRDGGDNQEKTEKALGKRRMEDADLILVKGDAKAAEQALHADQDQGENRQSLHPSPLFGEDRGNGEHRGDESDPRGNQAV